MLDTLRSAIDDGLLAAGVVVLAAGPAAPSGADLFRRLALERGLAVVDNDRPAAGLARSLRLGLEALEGLPVGAAAVLLGDQPRTRPEVLAALVGEWRRSGMPILVPRYRGAGLAAGNPVVLGREAWPLARGLRGDAGMSAVVRRRPELVAYLEVAGANPDVDVPSDIDALAGSSG